MREYVLHDEQETVAFGAMLGRLLKRGDVVLLYGELGSGKTTLVKGIGKALHISKIINSPTFTILKSYEGDCPLYHIDAYRLAGSTADIGLDEYFYGDGICCVEWPEYLYDACPRQALILRLTAGINDRKVIVQACGARYEALREEIVWSHSS